MIDINYGNYTLFQYLIIAFTLFPIEIIHSWLIVMVYLVITLITLSTLSKLFERRHPCYKEKKSCDNGAMVTHITCRLIHCNVICHIIS